MAGCVGVVVLDEGGVGGGSLDSGEACYGGDFASLYVRPCLALAMGSRENQN